MGKTGRRGEPGPTGPTGASGVVAILTDTSNPGQSLNGAQSDVAITDLAIELTAGTYVAAFDADVLNNADNSNGTYQMELNGVLTGQPRSYEPGLLVNARGTKKFVINETFVLASPATLTVSITQTVGEIVVNRSTLVVLKTA